MSRQNRDDSRLRRHRRDPNRRQVTTVWNFEAGANSREPESSTAWARAPSADSVPARQGTVSGSSSASLSLTISAHQLVLDAVVQVTPQAPALLAIDERRRSRGPRRLHRPQVAYGRHPRSRVAAPCAKLCDLILEFAASGIEREKSTAHRRRRLSETVERVPSGTPDPAGLVTLLTRVSDCCVLCIAATAKCRSDRPPISRLAIFPSRSPMCRFPRMRRLVIAKSSL